MPKSGTPNSQPVPKEPTIQPSKTENLIPTQSNILGHIVNHQIAYLIALIASLLAIGMAIHDALRDPDISSDLNADASQPFAFPFNVKNNSWFSMHDAQMYCGIDKIMMTNNRSLEGFSVVDIIPATIGPSEIVNF